MSSQIQFPSQHGRRETSFIETSGGLFTEQLLYRLRVEDCSESAVQPGTFAFPGTETPQSSAQLEERISEAWEDLVERWDEISRDNEVFGMDVSAARTKWMLRFFNQLGFKPEYEKKTLSADGVKAKLSHHGWVSRSAIEAGDEAPDAMPPILHMVQPDPVHHLDNGNHAGSNGKSPHDDLQTYLNASEQLTWSVVTDGLNLRLLRDYYHTYTRGYVEFDLENIFTNRNYEDFRALYRLCHASRFVESLSTDEEDKEAESPIEQLYQIALSTGVKVGQDLQENVVNALETLGNGFLNGEIKKALEEGGQDVAEDYYQDLLYVIYRLLFLMFTEQRGIMSQRDSLYTEEYSITKLRERAEQREKGDRNTDLWEGLKTTFRLVGQGEKELNVPGYNGGLFDDGKLKFILNSECPNDKLLTVIHDLTHVEQEGFQQRISYADLGVEEIGAVYESLLEFSPQVAESIVELEDRTISKGNFYLDDRGMERKETGSYYTDPGLIDELIESSLKPVVDERVDFSAAVSTQEEQLLSISVCDPACGSGAFLISASDYLGLRLSKIRAESEYPDEQTKWNAKREVVQHCIYGVDKNPMAVELAKVSVWINSAVEDKPLSFLDHHIRCGNSMVGATSSLMEKGFPVDIYETSGGRDWHNGNEIRARVREENKKRDRGDDESTLDKWSNATNKVVDLAQKIENISESSISDIRKKQNMFYELRSTEAFAQEKQVRDLWVAAAYWPMDGSVSEYPTPSTLEKIRRNTDSKEQNVKTMAEFSQKLAIEENFFHWDIEFPDVFYGDSDGFDVILGNPPWEKPKINEKEWFTGKNQEIAGLDSQDKRRDLINGLKEDNPKLHSNWERAQKRTDQMLNFLRNSGKYPLSGRGDINTYPIFTELAADELVNDDGYMGLVVKTGIATDFGTKELFGHFVEGDRLVSLYDFENTEAIFEDVERNERFCLLTITGDGINIPKAKFSFHNKSVKEMKIGENKYSLDMEMFKQINPNTKNSPTFRSKKIRDIVVGMYQRFPVLINDDDSSNPWGISYNTIYHMSNDSDKFASNTLEELRERGGELTNDNKFKTPSETYLPLYEGKYIHQYDHRFGTFDGVAREDRLGTKAETRKPSSDEKTESGFEVLPRYWVAASEFESDWEGKDWDEEWIFAFRKIARSHTDVRTAVGTITPMYPHGDGIPVLTFDTDDPRRRSLQFMSIFTSFVFDFALRQSLGGANLNKYILKQLPMPRPSTIRNITISTNSETVSMDDFLIERALKLVWTSNSIDSIGEPFDIKAPTEWDQEKRNEWQREIEAAVAHLYSLNRSNFEYIIDQFDVLREKEVADCGRFETKEKTLEKFDELAIEVKE